MRDDLLSRIKIERPLGFHLTFPTLNSLPPSTGMSQTEAPDKDQMNTQGDDVEMAR